MLIIILRAVGSQLRADDPGALKEIILDAEQVVGAGGCGRSRRDGVHIGGGERPERACACLPFDA